MIRRLLAGVLMLGGAWLCVRELRRQASGRGGRKSLLVLGFALCAAGVLISQA